MKLGNIKSFRDRNPYLVGLVSVLVIGALCGFAFMIGLLRIFEQTYTVTGVFSDGAGVKGGDEVRVAGVKAGRVVKIEPDHRRGRVIIEFEVNKGVNLGADTKAEVTLETLLGAKYLRLTGEVSRPYLADLPPEKRVIPLERTKIPFDVFELTRIGTRGIQQTDTEKLNTFINDLADVTEGQRENITELVTGIDRVARAINERETQLRQLLDRSDRLTATLAEKDQTLVALLDQSEAILELVAQRRDDVAAALSDGNTAVGELARVLSENKAELDNILGSLHPTLQVVDRHQEKLDRALAVAGPGFYGQALAASHGPWADIYVRGLGPDVIQILEDAFTQIAQGSQP